MVKDSFSQKSHVKRNNIIQNHQENIQNIRKPRKLVNKNNCSLKNSLTNIRIKPLNFYQTIKQIPSYQLTTKDMQSDPIKLINQLQQKYYQYGAIKLIVSDSWNCPFTFRYVDKQITTRIQCLQKLKQGKPFEQKVRAYRIQAYEAMSYDFQNKYKYRTNPKGNTEDSIIEEQYWNLVSKPQYQNKPVQVQYAADLSSSVYGSGFPTQKISNWRDSDFQYETNYFNLNNISKSPSSLLAITQKKKQKISGISYPWLYMGMRFSTFCWHVEDSFVNSLNYNHKGSTKTWYFVPGLQKEKFDKFVQEQYTGISKKRNILQKIVLMIDPQQLIKKGITVYKAHQRPRQYVCTFFKTYHGGFSQGFNVGEAVNFISARSLKYIDQAQKYYLWLEKNCDYKPKALVLSKDWLIHQNIEQKMLKNLLKDDQLYIKLQYNKMIARENQYVKSELIDKKKLDYVNIKKSINILAQNYKYQKLGCEYCKNYIYLFAIQCKKCGILCENHIERCQCAMKNNMFDIWIRKPNKDRVKQTYQNYQILMKAIREYQVRERNQNINRNKTSGIAIKQNSNKCQNKRSRSVANIEIYKRCG